MAMKLISKHAEEWAIGKEQFINNTGKYYEWKWRMLESVFVAQVSPDSRLKTVMKDSKKQDLVLHSELSVEAEFPFTT